MTLARRVGELAADIAHSGFDLGKPLTVGIDSASLAAGGGSLADSLFGEEDGEVEDGPGRGRSGVGYFGGVSGVMGNPL